MKLYRSRALALVTLLAAAAATDSARAQELQLGSVAFPNSGAAEAQESFLQGLALLHSFEYPEAREAFREAQRIDPEFAMAYWGEAMAWNYPLWYRQFHDEALEALGRYGTSPAERQARAPTEREGLWLTAIDALYGDGDKQARDDRYERVMEEIHRRFPDDPEAAAFHALAILGTAHEGRDHDKYVRAGAIALETMRRHPDHPGAAHYIIHSFDDPTHASLGLDAAIAYSRIAPDADHAQHMTTHIFLALGMWDDVVRANERADAVADRSRAAQGNPASSCGHYNEWLLYGYLMQERADDALRLLQECGAQVAGGDGSVESYTEMRSRYLLDSEDWDGGALTLGVDVSDHAGAALTDAYIRGFASARRGDIEGTRSALSHFRSLRPAAEARLAEIGLTEETYVRRPEILGLQLEGLLDWVLENYPDAIAHFGEAAEIEASLPHSYGPPVIEKPSWELLGEALLARNSDTTAAEAFATAVARAPGRVPSLNGLAAAAEAAGDAELAAWARAQLMDAGAEADSGDR
jgi:tetratricopeptide (TPR) repeat protein